MQHRDRACRVAERTIRIAVRAARKLEDLRSRQDRAFLNGPYLGVHENGRDRNDRHDLEQPLQRHAPWPRSRGVSTLKTFASSCHISSSFRFFRDQCTAAIATAWSSNPPPSARIRLIDSASWRERNSASRLCCASSGDSAESTSR